jgi:ubiquinone/menaquinone biosynthesis C-methylase UbiE
MDTQSAYNRWAAQYDLDQNKTRDLEAVALRQTLDGQSFQSCLEIGCGTGKNTPFLATISRHVAAVDFSAEMLRQARTKVTADNVEFRQADILQPWTFAADRGFDLITFSLVLEHVERLEPIFREAASCITPRGQIYVGELHPFKQYAGTKARFETPAGTTVVNCFNHHISDFTSAAAEHGFSIAAVHEFFDKDDHTTIPRLLAMLFSHDDHPSNARA